ncbi:expressed unknown protein [Seminavis robusta]|uniref:Uncharacterized protein n=1 Tax=Seminavis robusta TaxID=568900 RepID=A0A9N8DTF5_9STRA|nr:expressed unknown protein [Seminavis robusta]|eukprot:Sro344_g122150.1 n/a (276) ;mRNA; r:17799-18760
MNNRGNIDVRRDSEDRPFVYLEDLEDLDVVAFLGEKLKQTQESHQTFEEFLSYAVCCIIEDDPAPDSFERAKKILTRFPEAVINSYDFDDCPLAFCLSFDGFDDVLLDFMIDLVKSLPGTIDQFQFRDQLEMRDFSEDMNLDSRPSMGDEVAMQAIGAIVTKARRFDDYWGHWTAEELAPFVALFFRQTSVVEGLTLDLDNFLDSPLPQIMTSINNEPDKASSCCIKDLTIFMKGCCFDLAPLVSRMDQLNKPDTVIGAKPKSRRGPVDLPDCAM